MAARISSRWSWGYSVSISSIVDPEARKSNRSDTQIRVPRTHGLPKQILGLIEMRCNRGFILNAARPLVPRALDPGQHPEHLLQRVVPVARTVLEHLGATGAAGGPFGFRLA